MYVVVGCCTSIDRCDREGQLVSVVATVSVYVVVGCCASVERCDMEGQLVSGVVTECVCCCRVLHKC